MLRKSAGGWRLNEKLITGTSAFFVQPPAFSLERLLAYEPFRSLHRPSCRHHADEPGDSAAGRRELRLAAGVAAAGHGFSGDHRAGQPAGRQPGDHGVQRGHSAGTLPGKHRRRQPDEQPQQPGFDAHNHPVRPGPRHQRCRPRGTGGDQRRAQPVAQRNAQHADLPQGQPGTGADHGAFADLGKPRQGPALRRCLDHPRAEAVAGSRCRRGADRRQFAAGGARGAAAATTGAVRRLARRSAPDHRLGQRAASQGHGRGRGAPLAGPRQRPVAQRRRLPAADHPLPGWRRPAPARCRPGARCGGRPLQRRFLQQRSGGAADRQPPGRRQYHRDHRRHSQRTAGAAGHPAGQRRTGGGHGSLAGDSRHAA